MDFNYKELGEDLAWHRMQRALRQIDIENLSHAKLKQPAISAIERGELRISVDQLITYCNTLGIRTDTVLSPYLLTAPEEENSGAIVDPYVTQFADIIRNYSPSKKQALIEITELLRSI